MRHSVCPLLNRTSTRVGPLSCTSWVYPVAGVLEPSEIVDPDRCTTIEPPADVYGVSLLVGVVEPGAVSGVVAPAGELVDVPVDCGSVPSTGAPSV